MSSYFGRWRFIPTITQKTDNNTKQFYIKFMEIESINGYEFQVTDLNGGFWTERVDTIGLQERLKIQASGMEIESADLIKLLGQMCESFKTNEHQIEVSEDFKSIEIRGSVKIGFIRLKWTFKPEKVEDIGEYSKMLREDFLLPLFATLRLDKEIPSVVGEIDLETFYSIVPNLIRKPTAEMTALEKSSSAPVVEAAAEDNLNEIIVQEPQLEEPEMPVVQTAEEIEQAKRRALEEQLLIAKKKKKKLF